MNHDEAVAAVRECLAIAVPGADPGTLGPDDPFRDALEMDSIDFLTFVEALADRTGVAVAEDDYRRLSTLSSCAEFLQGGGPAA